MNAQLNLYPMPRLSDTWPPEAEIDIWLPFNLEEVDISAGKG